MIQYDTNDTIVDKSYGKAILISNKNGKHIKICSTSLAIMKMKMKNRKTEFFFWPIRLTEIKKYDII